MRSHETSASRRSPNSHPTSVQSHHSLRCDRSSPTPPATSTQPTSDGLADAAGDLHRYPDSAGYALTRAIADHHEIEPDEVWIGAGSTENLRSAAVAVGGPGTSAVFAMPSFVMYTIATVSSHATPVVVPLDAAMAMDLHAMLDAVRSDTTIVYICNPNNPTGGTRSGADVESFIDAVDERITVVIDEAYAEYVTDPGYRSMLSLAIERPNVLVTRTFSKIYGLAGLRVGYAVGDADLIAHLRIPQSPFTVNSLGQVAAIESLRHRDEVVARRERNASERDNLTKALRARGLSVPDSQANFVYFEPDGDAAAQAQALLERGVIVRPLGPGIRVSVGTPDENTSFLDAWDAVEIAGA